jgi:hypothetical protein
MLNLDNDPLLSLSEAARTIPPIDGKRPHPSTIFRWMTDGVRGGVKLEHIRVGRRICTTKHALERFFNALADAPKPEHQVSPKPPFQARCRTEAQRRHDVEEAKKRLKAAGAL